jgi:hypothetical protein
MSVKHKIQSIAIGAALFTLGGIGCGGGDDTGPLSSVDALVILQRPAHNDGGDIFQYTAYFPGSRLVQLKPPTADGQLTTLCCDRAGPDFANVDISGYDLSFDAKTIVFSGRLAENQTYGLFLLQLADGSVTQIATDPMKHYVSPVFLPGDRILFLTNEIEGTGSKQHTDEYERGETTQLGRVNIDGTGLELGARNLSHRTAPSLASDGRVIFTQWDHLGNENSGHLMFVNQDMQELREGFGKENHGASNSTLKAREISPGRFVAVATARSRTLQAGALIDIRLGDVKADGNVVSAPDNQSEAHSTYRQLTPDVPRNDMPSADTIGRYYDAFPLNARDKPDLLVSWANGTVESESLERADIPANFGIYLYDSEHQQRRPILDDPKMWDIFARPLATRTPPNIVGSAQDPRLSGKTLIGSLDVYSSTLSPVERPAAGQVGAIYGVRVMEGFSGEEGVRTFGTTMFEGHANLGVAPINADGSWSAKVPANIPIHLQTVDKFGMSLFNEPVWFSGRPGEARMCGGCHEDRTRTTNVSPGLLDTFAAGAANLYADKPRAQRINKTPTDATDIVGCGWDTLVQPILDTNCVGCHDATHNTNLGAYQIVDKTGAVIANWHLDLSGGALPTAMIAATGGATYSASYFSVAGPDMEAIEDNDLKIVGTLKAYMKPLDAHGSEMIVKLNPSQLFPTVKADVRAFGPTTHLQQKGMPDLSARDMYMLILCADMGVNFYARENMPASLTY